jgi:uncharacterized integral membrane protein
MTQPEHPPYNPNQPASQPTSTFPTGGGAGQPGGTGQLGQPGQPGAPGAGPATGPGRIERIKSGPGLFGYLLTLIAAVIAVGVAVFIAQNTDRTTIEFFGSNKSISLAGALGISVAAGFIVGLLIGLLPQFRLRRELRGYRRANRQP